MADPPRLSRRYHLEYASLLHDRLAPPVTRALLSLLFFGTLCVACGPSDLLEERPCPCIEGWTCSADRICVRGGGDTGFDAPDTPDAGSPNDLVASYSCETIADGVLPDDSGHGHVGTCPGGRCPALAAGREGLACLFDGLESYVRVAGDDEFSISEGFSVALWVNVRQGPVVAAASLLIGAGDSNTWQLFFIETEAGTFTPRYLSGDSEGFETIDGSTISADEWVYFVLTYDGVVKHLYANGELVASAEQRSAYSGQDLLIGADENNGTVNIPYFGLVDELQIYRRSFTADEVLVLFERY